MENRQRRAYGKRPKIDAYQEYLRHLDQDENAIRIYTSDFWLFTALLIDQASDEQIENLPMIARRDYGLSETQRGVWSEGLEYMRAWAHEALAEYLRQRTRGE